jgi:hypothetical protein
MGYNIVIILNSVLKVYIYTFRRILCINYFQPYILENKLWIQICVNSWLIVEEAIYKFIKWAYRFTWLICRIIIELKSMIQLNDLLRRFQSVIVYQGHKEHVKNNQHKNHWWCKQKNLNSLPIFIRSIFIKVRSVKWWITCKLW